ncbi:OmpA family protein [Xylophilus rhododendri]|uniref:OmpA family protein n=1 Tax=Xylophilus rhododendri TaxID=2697032 RepID=A0A857JA82_9BURK|nr:OmpA family protein [Xylophilus rhododendri]QHJ00921.1 OmpA family protein [Xylophilus rhododendri]
MIDRGRIRNWFLAGALLLAGSAGMAAADAVQADVKGGRDHPLIQRFSGSWMAGYKFNEWEQASFPSGMAVKDESWVDPVTVEGRVTKAIYVSPPGKSPLEVFRNYEQALTGAGFQRRFSCESQCAPLYRAMRRNDAYTSGMTWAAGSVITPTGSRYSLNAGTATTEQGRFWYGTLPRNGQLVHVLIYSSVASDISTNQAATFVQVAEPKAMPTGQVTVDTEALDKGLKAEGRIALYGLFFDTGKAQIKPESTAQLAEMAKLLKAQPALRVYIVGHTDNQGSLESNMALSQQRAQAVAGALAASYKIEAARMVGRGVASLAPLASNAAEEGRAKNRRVELVLQ